MKSGKIKILIIDDSAVTRAVLQRILSGDTEIEVVGTAIDPIFAAQKIQKFQPDVITLDLEMPRMDGLTFLRKLMRNQPLPVVVISGNSPKSSHNAIKALEYGAVEIIEKPDISSPEKLETVSIDIRNAVKAAYSTTDKTARHASEADSAQVESLKLSQYLEKETELIVIGSSTGGPDILKQIFTTAKKDIPGIVVAQHMPALFTKSFADRLNMLSSLQIREAQNGDYIVAGEVLIIPGGYHGKLHRDSNGVRIHLNQDEKVNRHRPSVDVLFHSAVKINPTKTIGILLTGMGNDGANGLKALKSNGAFTIAQNEQSCAVFGMPKRAIETGAVDAALSPEDMSTFLNHKILHKR